MQTANNQNTNEPTRAVWQTPWSFIEASIVLIALLLVGFSLEWATNGIGLNIPHTPVNMYLGASILCVIVVLRIAFNKSHIVEFLSSTHNSISIIVAYLVMVILMGSITQIDARAAELVRRLGLSHVTSSWPFVLLNVYFLLVLGLVTARRLRPFTIRNFAFFVNHCGLWIVVFAGGMGTGDLQRLQMNINTFDEKPTWKAKTDDQQEVEVPFAIRLLKFTLEEYLPKLTLIDNETGDIFHGQGKNLYLVEEGLNATIADWQLKLLQYLPEAGYVNNVFYRVNELGAPPAAQFEITDKQGKVDTAWVSCGSFNNMPVSHTLNEKFSIVLTVPEPKRYESKVIIYNPIGETDTVLIEVNKAKVVNGYKIYQLGFDEKYGKWSETSTLEVVYDPWQPFVYTGIFMLLSGGLYLLYMGQRTQTIRNEEIQD